MRYQYCVITRWRNRQEAESLITRIRDKGKTVYSFFEGDDDRDAKGEKSPEEFMKEYENIPNWRQDPNVRKIFETDMQALRDSETVILLLPAGKSAHIEAGVAYGLGKNLVLIGEQKETESLYLIFNHHFQTMDEFINTI